MSPQGNNQDITSENLREQLRSLREFTAAEFSAQRSSYLKLWKTPLEHRITWH